MKRSLDILLLAVAIAAAGCVDRRPGNVAATPVCGGSVEARGDVYYGVIFPPTCYVQVDDARVVSHWMPSQEQVAALERELRAALEGLRGSPAGIADPSSSHSLDRFAYLSGELGGILERLDQYRRQYAGITLRDGRRRILVNCFPAATSPETDQFADWKGRWVSVLDGGNSYWRIQYEVGSGRFFEFDVNGYA